MKILISGAGIAGLTAAFWLKKFGFDPVVIEVSPTLRNKGYMMDYFGSGYDVGKAMGLNPALKKLDSRIEKFEFLDKNQKTRGTFDRNAMRDFLGDKYFTIMRGELEDVLYEKVKNNVEIRFGTSIKAIKQDEQNTEVTFENGEHENFDLVIGADGIHSQVRKLIFGQEQRFSHFLGYYVAAFIVPNDLKFGNSFYSYAEVNRLAGVYPIGDGRVATLFVFKSEDLGFVPPEKRSELLKKVFTGSKSFVPELLNLCTEDHDVFFDAVTQIKIDKLTNGRVALIGDAGACLTLLAGQGATMAMVEAYILANELRKTKGDYQTAFENYNQVLIDVVKQKQMEAEKFTTSFVPKNKLGLWIYNCAVKFMRFPWVLKLVFKNFNSKSLFDQDYDFYKG